MFGFGKKDPLKKLQKDYQAKLERARDQQRQGDVLGSAMTTAEAEEIAKEIARLEEEGKSSPS